MKLSCAACGAVASLDVLIGHEGARDAVMAAMAMPAPIGKIMVQYVGLFRPAKRNLSMDRLASLISELLPMITDAKIERNGRIYSAPYDYWKMAMEDMLIKRDKLTLPLKNHGYLFSIIEGYNLKAEAKTETQTEARKSGHTPVGGGYVPPSTIKPVVETAVRQAMPESVKAALRRKPDDTS
ncbi:MAG: hypothetical protein WCK93_07570 [Nitrosomonadales bacterium]